LDTIPLLYERINLALELAHFVNVLHDIFRKLGINKLPLGLELDDR
jgi:hypothetical protein